MNKAVSFLPWSMRMVVVLVLITMLIQQDILLYIISSINLLLLIFTVWGCVKSGAKGTVKALTGNRTHNIFDVSISVFCIATGLYLKDTTMVIEGGVLLTVSVLNILSPAAR